MQVGAVIVFSPTVTKVQAKYILEQLKYDLLQDPNNRLGEGIESVNVQEFNPEHSHPVFYCP